MAPGCVLTGCLDILVCGGLSRAGLDLWYPVEDVYKLRVNFIRWSNPFETSPGKAEHCDLLSPLMFLP